MVYIQVSHCLMHNTADLADHGMSISQMQPARVEQSQLPSEQLKYGMDMIQRHVSCTGDCTKPQRLGSTNVRLLDQMNTLVFGTSWPLVHQPCQPCSISISQHTYSLKRKSLGTNETSIQTGHCPLSALGYCHNFNELRSIARRDRTRSQSSAGAVKGTQQDSQAVTCRIYISRGRKLIVKGFKKDTVYLQRRRFYALHSQVQRTKSAAQTFIS